MRKIYLTSAFVFTLGLFLQSTQADNKHNSPTIKPKIGYLLTLSGKFASAGEDCRKGIEAGLDISGKRNNLEVMYADSQNDPRVAIDEYNRLINVNNISAIYTHRSSMGMTLNPLSNKSHLPLLGAVGHQDFASKNAYSFQIWPKSDDEGQFVALELTKAGYSRIALIFTEDEWTSSVSEGFRKKIKELKGNLIFDQAVLPSETDFLTLLTKIKHRSPDAIYFNLLLPQIAPILKKSRELGITSEYYSNFYASHEDVINSAGINVMRGVKYVEIDTNLPKLKLKLGISETSSIPGLTVASYVGTMLLTQAITGNSNSASPTELYEALLTQDSVVTPDHIYKIKERVVQFPLVISQIK